MPIQLDIEFPDDNQITLSPQFLEESDAVVTIRGRGNRLHIEKPFAPNSAKFLLSGAPPSSSGQIRTSTSSWSPPPPKGP